MDFLQPTTWDEALAAKAAHPDAVPLCGGTDVMVELNFDRRRPAALLDLGRVRRAARVGSGGRPRPPRRRRDLQPGHRRARRPAARPRDGLAHGRLAADPQPRHGRGQPGRRLAGRRRAPAAAGGRHAGWRSRSVRGHAGDPGRGLLHRRQAQRPGAGRADPRRAGHARRAARSSSARSAPATRWSSRSRRSASRCTPTARRSAPASARPPRRRAGRAPPRSTSRPRSTSWACGSRAARCHRAWPWSSASWCAPPPRRSTTSAAARPTGCTRSR